MPRKLFLKPKTGLSVWLPERNRYVKADGETVEVDSYIARRMADGDLVEVSLSKTLNTKKTEAADVHSVRTNSGK